MRRLAAAVALLGAVLAMASVGAASATAAQTAAERRLANEQRALAVAPRTVLLARLRATDRQFHLLERRIQPCPLAQADLVAAFRLHQLAIRRAARAGAASLRKRNSQLSRGLVLLSGAAQRCAVADTPVIPPMPAPPPVLVSGPAPVAWPTPAPAPRPAPGPGPGPGPGPAPGPGSTTPAPTITVRVAISLANVVNGETLDVSQALGTTELPPVIAPLDLAELQGPSCTRRGAVCLGFDRPLLWDKVRELMNDNLLVLLLRNVATVNVSGVLTQISQLITANDLSALIEVQRVGDRALRLVPIGPLAELSGLPDIPVADVAQLQVVR